MDVGLATGISIVGCNTSVGVAGVHGGALMMSIKCLSCLSGSIWRPIVVVLIIRNGPQITCAHKKGSLAPQINCAHFYKQPFRLGTGGDWGFRGGGRGQGNYTWRCSTMNKHPFRLGTGGTWVLGVRTGDSGLIHGDVLQ